MHLTIVDHDTYVACIATSQRAALHAVHDSLQNSGHETNVDGTTDDRVDKLQFAAPRKVFLLLRLDVHLELLTIELIAYWIGHTFCIWLDDECYLTELSGTTALLLMAVGCLCLLRDGLTVRNTWLLVFDIEFLIVFQTPFQYAEMELSLSVHDGLAELLALLHDPCRILLAHLQQSCHNLFEILRILRFDSTRIFRTRIFYEVELHILVVLAIERVASLHILQLHSTSDVTGFEFVNRDTVASCTSIDLSETLLRATVSIREIVTGFHLTTHHLEVAHLTDMRFHTCLEEVKAFKSIAISWHLLTACIAVSRHVTDERHNIAQELHQALYAHVLMSIDTEDREDVTVDKTLADAEAQLVLRE